MIDFFVPDKEYFSIKEVTKVVQIPAYVLRYWESEFKLLRPARRASGQRKYTKKDIEQIFKIKDLLYMKKYTIAGAKKALISEKRKTKQTSSDQQFQLNFEMGQSRVNPSIIREIKKELEEIVKILKDQ
ncbi:MAG: MerR family transcriptional regulator [Endomicrobiales bacterium]|nr:MerR family transcriptional regulator [Endomicrobiales bacterium]